MRMGLYDIASHAVLARWSAPPCPPPPPVVECGGKGGVLMLDWLTMQNITFGIAVAGFIMSLLSCCRDFFLRRNRIEMTVLDYVKHPSGVIQFLCLFQNKSSIPASVSNVSINTQGRKYDCEFEPKLVKGIEGKILISTPAFPLSLSPIAFSSYYFEFLGAQDISLTPGTTLIFQIHTSRGVLTKLVVLGDKGHYLHTM